MRTAITLAVDHEGKATVLYGPEVGLDEQARSFKALPREASDPKHQEVHIWHSDAGIVKSWKYKSPVDQKALEEKQARDQKTFDDAEAARRRQPSPINAPLANLVITPEVKPTVAAPIPEDYSKLPKASPQRESRWDQEDKDEPESKHQKKHK